MRVNKILLRQKHLGHFVAWVTLQLFHSVPMLLLTGLAVWCLSLWLWEAQLKNRLAKFLPVNLKGLCELKHIVVVVKHGGDAHSEVILHHFPFVVLGFNVSYGEPSVVNILHVVLLIHKYNVSSCTVLRHRTHDVCSNVGEPIVVRVP